MNSAWQYTTMQVDHMLFGIRVDAVQEVIPTLPATPVPLTTNVVAGLINLRGQIVMEVDLRAHLGLPPRAPDQSSVSLVLRTGRGLVSLRADRLGEVHGHELSQSVARDQTAGPDDVPRAMNGLKSSADEPRLEPLPANASGPLRRLTRGIIQLEESLLLILDPELLADPADCLAIQNGHRVPEAMRSTDD